MISRWKAHELRRLIEKASFSLEDKDALDGIELYAQWEPGLAYAVGDRRRHENALYRCVQAHTSQDDWTPDVTPALWVIVSLDEFPEWIQPTGAQDAYSKGDKVTHNGKHWISTVDANVYEPPLYWDET